ncbi:hypothetical protein ACWJJH_09275 [Endozoicomonadaceae bacterium StTr2]
MDRRAGEGRLWPLLISLGCCSIFFIALVNAYEMDDVAEALNYERDVEARVFNDTGQIQQGFNSSGSLTAQEAQADISEEVRISIDIKVPTSQALKVNYQILSDEWRMLAGARLRYNNALIPATLYAGEKLAMSVIDDWGNVTYCLKPQKSQRTLRHYLEVGSELEAGDILRIETRPANFDGTQNSHRAICIYTVEKYDV